MVERIRNNIFQAKIKKAFEDEEEKQWIIEWKEEKNTVWMLIFVKDFF